MGSDALSKLLEWADAYVTEHCGEREHYSASNYYAHYDDAQDTKHMVSEVVLSTEYIAMRCDCSTQPSFVRYKAHVM
jgi:hypothetical protein